MVELEDEIMHKKSFCYIKKSFCLQAVHPYMPLQYHPGYYPPVISYRGLMPHQYVGGGRMPGGKVHHPRGVNPRLQVPVRATKIADKDKSGRESPVGGKKGGRPRTMMYPIPRAQLPGYYPAIHPAYPYGMPYYLIQEDPRVAAMHRGPYPIYPQHPYAAAANFGTPFQQSPPSHGSEDSGRNSDEGRDSRSLSPAAQGQYVTPSSSPSSTIAGQPIHFLPNAKHVPVHLLGQRSRTPTSNSRSSTPRETESPLDSGHRGEVQGELDYMAVAIDTQERARSSAQSPLGRVIASAQRRQEATIQSSSVYESKRETHTPTRYSEERTMAQHKSSLKISTGFSRQFSEDMKTPTEIKNLVKMIDEEGEDRSGTNPIPIPKNLSKSPDNTTGSAPGRLFLKIPTQQEIAESTESLSTSSSEGSDGRPTYARVVRRRLPSGSGDIDNLEPQTPHTPAGFTTPGAEVDTDPLGILKNLTINSSTENQRTYKYFS